MHLLNAIGIHSSLSGTVHRGLDDHAFLSVLHGVHPAFGNRMRVA
ncbi:MAG: hypothetical protein JWM31_1689 [Solirubrobacterales bacterium]|nr:hypothetical protein [Solirubrobacterales bacterium]